MTRDNLSRAFIADPEILAMLGDEPELLAIADAITQTQSSRRLKATRARPRERHVSRIAIVAIAVAAITLAALVVPLRQEDDVIGKALAAIGGRAVLHVVVTYSSPGDEVVRITSGRRVTRTTRVETWYDQSRSLKKQSTSLAGVTIGSILETRSGGFSSAGPVYSCSWIRAHPAKARAANLRCSRETQNSSTPIAEPALSGFVDRYQDALRSGQARKIGTGLLDGHAVIWLRLRASRNGPAEDVALKPQSMRPIAFRIAKAPGVLYRVSLIETIDHDANSFVRPDQRLSPVQARVVESTPTTIEAVAASRPWLMSLGPRMRNLELSSVRLDRISTKYRGLRVPRPSEGAELRYHVVNGPGEVILRESASCPFAYGFTCTASDPRVGEFTRRSSTMLVRLGRAYVQVSGSRTGTSDLAIARALRPAR